MYRFKEFYISDHMMDGLQRYLIEGIRPGDFLQAIICHRNLPAYADYIYNRVPSGCHGSEERMESWINKELYFQLYNRNHKYETSNIKS